MDIRIYPLIVSCDLEPIPGRGVLIAVHRSISAPFVLISDLPGFNRGISGQHAVPSLLPHLWPEHFSRGPVPAGAVSWILQDRARSLHRIEPLNTRPLDLRYWDNLRIEEVGDGHALAARYGAVSMYAVAATRHHLTLNTTA